MSRAPFAAVAASTPVTAATAGIDAALLSLAIGMIGVALARTVFVARENARLKRTQPFHETLPLTLAAMLITGVIVWERRLGLSMAAFTGLGVGWAAVLLLDIIGNRMIEVLRVLLGSKPDAGMEPDMADQLRKLDDDPTP